VALVGWDDVFSELGFMMKIGKEMAGLWV
jgi:hypothetical protein